MKLLQLRLREIPDPENEDKAKSRRLFIASSTVQLEADYTARVVRINGRVVPFEMVAFFDEMPAPDMRAPPEELADIVPTPRGASVFVDGKHQFVPPTPEPYRHPKAKRR